MTKPRILIIEDEPDIVQLLKYNLEKEGYDATHVGDGSLAFEIVKKERFNLLILDIMLPGMSGLDLCRKLKEEKTTTNIPIIMASAKDEEIDRILGLELGADDYITKPFSVREVMARVKAVLRRTSQDKKQQTTQETIKTGALELDKSRYVAKKNGTALSLSTREFNLLWHFAENPGKVYSRDSLLDDVWGDETFVEPRTVDVHIRRLREKVETDPANPEYIMTKRGAGYYFKE